MTIDRDQKYRGMGVRGQVPETVYAPVQPSVSEAEDILRRDRVHYRFRAATVCTSSPALVGQSEQRQGPQSRHCLGCRRVGDG